jgi:hypothetical protein
VIVLLAKVAADVSALLAALQSFVTNITVSWGVSEQEYGGQRRGIRISLGKFKVESVQHEEYLLIQNVKVLENEGYRMQN